MAGVWIMKPKRIQTGGIAKGADMSKKKMINRKPIFPNIIFCFGRFLNQTFMQNIMPQKNLILKILNESWMNAETVIQLFLFLYLSIC